MTEGRAPRGVVGQAEEKEQFRENEQGHGEGQGRPDVSDRVEEGGTKRRRETTGQVLDDYGATTSQVR